MNLCKAPTVPVPTADDTTLCNYAEFAAVTGLVPFQPEDMPDSIYTPNDINSVRTNFTIANTLDVISFEPIKATFGTTPSHSCSYMCWSSQSVSI